MTILPHSPHTQRQFTNAGLASPPEAPGSSLLSEKEPFSPGPAAQTFLAGPASQAAKRLTRSTRPVAKQVVQARTSDTSAGFVTTWPDPKALRIVSGEWRVEANSEVEVVGEGEGPEKKVDRERDRERGQNNHR